MGTAMPLIGVADGSWSVEGALRVAGAEVVEVNSLADIEAAAQYLDAIVLTGGGDVDPKRYGQQRSADVYGVDTVRDELEFKLVEVAKERKLNMMGICRGNQLLNVAHGGTLHQDITHLVGFSHWGMMAEVLFRAKASVSDALKELEVYGTHYHHQAIDRVGEGLVVAAWSTDGIVEAIESVPGSESYVLGTQFHPEMDYQQDEDMRRLFLYFVNRTKEKAAGRVATSKRRGKYVSATYRPKTPSTLTDYTKGWSGNTYVGWAGETKALPNVTVQDVTDYRVSDDDDVPAFLQGYSDDWDIECFGNEGDVTEYLKADTISPAIRKTKAWRDHCDTYCAGDMCWNLSYCDPHDGLCEEYEWQKNVAVKSRADHKNSIVVP